MATASGRILLVAAAIVLAQWPAPGVPARNRLSAAGQYEIGRSLSPGSTDATLAAQCAATIQSDRAIVSAGMTASGFRPLEIRTQLDKQVEVVRQVAARRGAALRLGDRVRIAQSLSSGSRRGEQEPLMTVQPFELELPVEADVDALVEELLPAGVDRLGEWTGPGHDAAPTTFVAYRVSQAGDALERVHQTCRRQAFEEWCAAHAAADVGCMKALEALSPRLPTRSLDLLSGDPPAPILSHGVPGLQLSYPWDAEDLRRLERLRSPSLRVSGRIVLAFPGSPR